MAQNGDESSSKGAQIRDCPYEAHPRTADADERGIESGGSFGPCQAMAGVGMNFPMPALSLSTPFPGGVKRKRVLLIDTSQAKRDLRAEVLRKLGMDVDCAADIAEARSWWKPGLYELVLVNMGTGRGQRDRFCDDLRSATPPQRLAFLVGQPEYLADSPHADPELTLENAEEQAKTGPANGTVPAEPGDWTQRWGILEASRRISQVRSASIARTRAMRDLAPPPRDSDGRPTKTNCETD